MNTSRLKQFAQNARKQLLTLVSTKLSIVLDTNSAARRENEKAVKELEKEISRTSKDQVIEKVAYIWFNRFCALRFMDVNRYTNIRVVSPAEGFSQPEILMEAKQGHIDADLRVSKDRIFGLLNETIQSPQPQQEAYRMLLVAVCNDYYSIMPFLFEKIADYTELLMPDDLLSDSSILTATREALSEEACADVEVIGWLYQFYISEKKDEVFAGLKKNKKVTPENIPAATQLFTPNWIVRYLVENSLGRLWMLNNPSSRIIDRMEYYIKPEQEETDFLVIKSPEEIKICDPACGSGHMLVYAFEILHAIYEEQGYDSPKIPELILENNLYGIEIDERAGELAAFALFMKAREKYRRFFKKKVRPNICVLENVNFEAHEVKSYLDAVNPDLFTMELSTLLYQFKEADNFGSLIRPELTNISDVLRLIDEKKVSDDMFLQGIHQRVLKALKQADYLCPKYHVVIANPPYLGKGMNARLGSWVRDNYPNSKTDLFSMFIERNIEMSLTKGLVSMITMQNWMFLTSFEIFREHVLTKHPVLTMAHIGARGFDSIGGEVVSTTAFVIKNSNQTEYIGTYLRLTNGRNEVEKQIDLKRNTNGGDLVFHKSMDEFYKIPGKQLSYWASENILNGFTLSKLGDSFDVKSGLTSGNKKLYVKNWFECSVKSINFNARNGEQNPLKWFPHNDGGSVRKWYGNRASVINWANDGEEIKNFSGSTIRSPIHYFKSGVTWSDISTSFFAARYLPEGSVFENTGSIVVVKGGDAKTVVGFLCSPVAKKYMALMNPTLHYGVGEVAKLPFKEPKQDIRTAVTECIKVAKFDWDSYETSWDFKYLPLICHKSEQLELSNPNFPLRTHLGEAYSGIRSFWLHLTKKVQQLEQDINQVFLQDYELEEELASNVILSEITLTCNPYYRYGNNKKNEELESLLLSDTIKEYISYSVGCMFGRYSFDKEGLILANQGDTIENYLAKIPEPTFDPDDDNVIPIMDVDWFPDDITERFKRFLKVTFGEEYYTENLEFIEKAIGKDIRKFFVKDFYAYHVQMYKKRPIYWMFSSPKGSFNALIYMHRYRPDTVSIVLNDYLREFRVKLIARKGNLENISISTSASQGEKTKALKEIEQIKKVMDEVDEYERDILYPLATKQIEIDLDDGVMVNYPKFGKALKNVTGLS